MKKRYYAIFTETRDAVEVEFPDIDGCVTFGGEFEEAYDMAVDVLAAMLMSSETQFIREPSTYKELKDQYPDAVLVPVPVDKKIMDLYAEKKRINVVFTVNVLSMIDEKRGKLGIRDRSKFISDGMLEYLKNV